MRVEMLIELLRGALDSMTGGSTIRAYGLEYRSESGERRHSVVLTDAARKKLAAARSAYAEYRRARRDDDGSEEGAGQ